MNRKTLLTLLALGTASFICGIAVTAVLMAYNLFTDRTSGVSPTRPAPTLIHLASPTPSLTAPPAPTATPFAPPSATPAPSATLAAPPATSPPLTQLGLTGKIVFVCYDGQDDELCLMNADGSGRAQLTNNSVGDFYPALSPDGQRIVFARQIRGSNYEIFSLNVDGTGERQLTSNGAQNYAPELSPDGRTVAYVSTHEGNAQHIWLMDADGANNRRLTSEGENIDPTWSPDGTQIAFASNRGGTRQLWVMNADGSAPRQVTDLADMGGRSDWSPDGARLTFYAGPRANLGRNVFIINVDGSGLLKLTEGGDNLGPAFSPDGAWVAFASFRTGRNTIFVAPSGGGPAVAVSAPTRSDYQPRWGP